MNPSNAMTLTTQLWGINPLHNCSLLKPNLVDYTAVSNAYNEVMYLFLMTYKIAGSV